jgi:hypothetical protein
LQAIHFRNVRVDAPAQGVGADELAGAIIRRDERGLTEVPPEFPADASCVVQRAREKGLTDYFSHLGGAVERLIARFFE